MTSYRGRLNKLQDKVERLKAARIGINIEPDPVEFCATHLGFKPTTYQEKLLRDPSQFIAARWSRQSGKTHCIAVLLLWSCLRNPGFNVLVVAPSMRQSKIIIRKISSFLSKLPPYVALKPQRTKIEFYNGSRIQAFPNNPGTIRGEAGVGLVYCLPGHVRVLRPDGSDIPIASVGPGESVLSYNRFTGLSESKRVVRLITSRLSNRRLVQVIHEHGSLGCTGEHKLYTINRGFVPAIYLAEDDQLLCISEASPENRLRKAAELRTRTVHPRGIARRSLPLQTEDERSKCPSHRKPFLQTSRVCSVQVQLSERVRQNPSQDDQESGLGNLECLVLHSKPSSVHATLQSGLSQQKENGHNGLARKDHFSSSPCNLVHGRWVPEQIDCLYPHTCFLHPRVSTPPGMAFKKMGAISSNLRRQAWHGFILAVSSVGERQALRPCTSLCNSKHGLQGYSTATEEEGWPEPEIEETTSDPPVHYLLTAFRDLSIVQENLRSGVQPREEDSISQDVQSPVQPEEAIPSNTQGNGKGPPFKGMHVLRQNLYASQPSSEDLQHLLLANSGPKKPAAVRGEEEDGEFVYNLEVEDNHNFFASGVLVSNCDEFGYVRDDRELYDAVVFTLSTTNGRFIATSTPGSRDSLFYAMCTNDEEFGDVSRHHVSYREALEPNGPLKPEILEKLKRQLASDPWRWTREMEAEFADDEDAWLNMALISKCVDQDLEYIPDTSIFTK